MDFLHVKGGFWAVITLISGALAGIPQIETIVRIAGIVLAGISAFFASRYYHMAYLEKKENVKKLKSQ